jgi:multidrug efflux system membrane fusion protein
MLSEENSRTGSSPASAKNLAKLARRPAGGVRTNLRKVPQLIIRRGARGGAWVWVLVVCLLAAAAVGGYFYRTHLFKSAADPAGQPAPRVRTVPVVAVKAWKADISIRIGYLGAVTPLYTVTVRSRVDGQLMDVKFTEGQFVEKDSLLGIIDPRPFEAQLLQAQGQLIRDEAFLANARLDLKRYEELLKQDSIAAQQRDTQAALVQQYEGTVKMDQGVVDNAQVQLIYTHITAPLSGRVGLRLVDPGNIIHAADVNGFVVITQLQPISVIFTVPEDDLPQVLAKFNAGERLEADARDRSGFHKLAEGRLEWVDNQIDPTTGMVRMRAIFPNKNNELFAGQFVNISLLLEVKHDTTVAPAAAIQRGPNGTFVYVIGADDIATVKQVRVGPTEGDNASFESGLAVGDLVVVEGADRLREGQKVELSTSEGPNGSGAPEPSAYPNTPMGGGAAGGTPAVQGEKPAPEAAPGTSAGESKPATPPAGKPAMPPAGKPAASPQDKPSSQPGAGN